MDNMVILAVIATTGWLLALGLIVWLNHLEFRVRHLDHRLRGMLHTIVYTEARLDLAGIPGRDGDEAFGD